MSATAGETKVSDVLKILSVESITNDNDWNIPSPSEKPRNYALEKQIFTDAVHYCMVLLRQSNRITNHKSDILSLEATLTGHEIFERIINVNVQTNVEAEYEVVVPVSNFEQQTIVETTNSANNQDAIKKEIAETIIDDQEVVTSPRRTTRSSVRRFAEDIGDAVTPKIDKTNRQQNEFEWQSSAHRIATSNRTMDENNFPMSPVSGTDSEGSENSFESKKRSQKSDKNKNFISLEVKEKVVELARMHPEWSVKMLRKHGSRQLNTRRQLLQWQRHVAKGGTLRDKYKAINEHTYQRFIDARDRSQIVTTDMLREWAIQASRDFYGRNFKFEATRSWVGVFRKMYNIGERCSIDVRRSRDKKVDRSSNLVERSRRKSTAN